MDPILLYAILYVLGAILLLILYIRWNYGFLEKLGIPVEAPTWLCGSCPDIYNKYPQFEDIARFKKYGSVFGVYEGRSPQILIADPELVKLILVRDYDHFRSRSAIDLGHAISNEILDYLPDDRWKAVRSMLSPALTATRLKNQMDVMNEITQEFVHDISEECTEDRMKFDFRNRVITVLIDIAATGLYGLELENRKDPDNAFVQLMKQILCEHVKYDGRYVFMQVLPILKWFFPGWPFPIEGLQPFRRVMRGYLKAKKKDGDSGGDLGDVFLNMMDRINSPEFQNLGITENTAIAQVLEVFFATYDSTGTATTMTAYYLAKNPEIQSKVVEELDAVMTKHGEINPSALNDMIYLTACINEALRLCPPFIRPERKCTKDWFGYRDNGMKLKIPKGANVLIPIWAMHRHPEYFPDPEKYDPKRFMPENKEKLHSYSFAPFGHGPKNCIGMKLAYMAIKTILARILLEFRLEERPDTKLQYKPGRLFVTQFEPIYFDLVRRK